MSDFRDFPIDSLMKLTTRPELVFVRGEGSWLWDHTGKKYLDFVQGWAVNCLGHAPPTVTQALSQQASRLLSPSPAFYNDQAIQLAKLLTEHSPFHRIFFANCGAEANEGAIKLARKWGKLHKEGAFEIITFVNAFHGRTLATMSASGKPGWDTMFAPQVPGFPKAFLNDLPSVEKLLHAKTVAIMLEPVQGEAGVLPATPAFLHGLREICDREKLLLICDEVQTGCGRLGTLWGFESFPALVPSGIRPLVPDIMTLGKGIGGGVPLAALCAKESASVFETGEQGGTYNGNPLMCAAGLAVINEVRQPEFLKHVLAMGESLAGGLRELSAELGLGEVRGKGLLLALELGKDIGGQVVVSAREEGLLLNSPRPACLRFMPALNVTPGEIDLMLQVLRRSIAKNI